MLLLLFYHCTISVAISKFPWGALAW